MREKLIIAPTGDLYFEATKPVKDLMLEAFTNVATGLMHLTESESVEIAAVTPPGLEPALGIRLLNPRDPDWVTRHEGEKMLMAALIGAHSRAMEHSTDCTEVMKTPLAKLFPDDTDLFEDQEGGEQ